MIINLYTYMIFNDYLLLFFIMNNEFSSFFKGLFSSLNVILYKLFKKSNLYDHIF